MSIVANVLFVLVFVAIAHAAGDDTQAIALGNFKDATQACFGDATPFFLPGDPDKVLNCCIAPQSITWFNQDAQTGECCAPGQSWTGNQTTLEGGCCDIGQNWSQDKPSGLGGCCAPSLSFVGDRATKTGGCCSVGMRWLNGKCAPPPPRPTCQDLADPVCGGTDDLGIQYGHCYILKFPDGTQLGSNHDDPAYAKDGFFKDIPFKVCRSTTDCALGEAVPSDGKFLLQDQMGRPGDAKGTIGWADNGTGGTHIKFNTNATQAGIFEGIAACSDGKCYIRLRRISAACPTPDHGLTFRNNPKFNIMISFTETACSGPDAPFVPVTAANPAGLLGAFRPLRPSGGGGNINTIAAPVSQQAASSLVASATSERASATEATVTTSSLSVATIAASAPTAAASSPSTRAPPLLGLNFRA